jgi:hypothetical protein
MAAPNQKFLSPQIMKVLEPSTGFYEVWVKMDSSLASKYPNSPFGLSINKIGLSSKDSDKYPDHVLVSVEPADKEGDSHFWIFQKLPGPLLSGEQSYVERTKATMTSQDVEPGTEAEKGLLIVQSSVKPDGMGKSVKEVVAVDSWPELIASDWDGELGSHTIRKEQFVSPPILGAANTSYQIVNEDRSLKITEEPPVNALNSYFLSFPTRFNLDLPKVLKSIQVVWSEQFSIGTQDTWAYDYASGPSGSISLSIPDRASSSASITADLIINYEDFAANNLFTETCIFYMQGPITKNAILSKVGSYVGGISYWPVFRPQSQGILVTGQGVSVTANVSVALSNSWSETSNSNSSTKSVSDDFSVTLDNKMIQLPPCIHTGIQITGGTQKSQLISATAMMAISTTFGASVSASKTKTGTAYGLVSPNYLPPTEGTNIVPRQGKYLMDADVSQTKWENWFKVRAEVFDASDLA